MSKESDKAVARGTDRRGVATLANLESTAAGVWPADDHMPHVIAWNLTRRCNLECAHCYISAGAWHAAAEEMATADCLRVVDEILEVSNAPMLILSGVEQLLR